MCYIRIYIYKVYIMYFSLYVCVYNITWRWRVFFFWLLLYFKKNTLTCGNRICIYNIIYFNIHVTGARGSRKRLLRQHISVVAEKRPWRRRVDSCIRVCVGTYSVQARRCVLYTSSLFIHTFFSLLTLSTIRLLFYYFNSGRRRRRGRRWARIQRNK